jgi:hypothetical protein
MPGGRISDQKRRLPITLRTVEDWPHVLKCIVYTQLGEMAK